MGGTPRKNLFYHPDSPAGLSQASSFMEQSNGMRNTGNTVASMVQQERAKIQEERRKMREEKERLMEDWGLQNEESKRIFEQRYKKMMARKQKSTNPSAKERHLKFMANKK